MIKHTLLGLFALSISLSHLSAQSLPLPLQSKGDMPEVFRTPTSEKVAIQRNNPQIFEDENQQEAEEIFYVESNYGIDRLLSSGSVLYGDEISEYVSAVADNILADDPELRSKLQFFVLYSPFPNAFATQRGDIFINMGLIARLENEAQLAFILCHEIAHFQEQHSLNQYIEYKANAWKDQSYRSATNQQKLLIRNNYSRTQEMEADSLGYLLFRKSPYSSHSLPEVFDIFAGAENPIGYPSLPSDWLSSGIFPASMVDSLLNGPSTKSQKAYYVMDGDEPVAKASPDSTEKEGVASDSLLVATDSAKISPPPLNRVGVKISNVSLSPEQPATIDEEQEQEQEQDEDEDESNEEENEGTHPSPEKRKAALISWSDRQPTPGEATFFQGVEDFLLVRRLARLESAAAWLHQGAYVDALLTARWLDTEGESDPYLAKIIAKSLYGLAATRLESESNFLIQELPADKKDAVIWVTMMKKLKSRDASLLALGYLSELYSSDTLAHEWVLPYLQNLSEKVEQNAFEGKGRKSMAGTELAISQLRQDSVYNRIYRKAIKKNTRIREIDEYLDTAAGEKEYDTWKKTHARNGYELGLDSVFVLAPSFYRIDATKKQQRIRWETSELLQDDFYSQIPAISSKKGLHIEMRDPNHYTSATQTPAYNEFMQLQQWVDEMIERPELVPSNQDEILILLKKYNIDHVTLFGAYSVKRNANLLLQGAIILTIVGPGVLIPSLMPVITYQLFKKRETGFLYMMVFDLQDPDLDFRTTHLTNYKVNELTSSKFLDFFIQQIKAKP